MSASILWQPATPPEGESLHTMAPQAFMRTLRAIGWDDGGELSNDHLVALKGLAATISDDERYPNPYKQLIEAIETHGTIRVWPEY